MLILPEVCLGAKEQSIRFLEWSVLLSGSRNRIYDSYPIRSAQIRMKKLPEGCLGHRLLNLILEIIRITIWIQDPDYDN